MRRVALFYLILAAGYALTGFLYGDWAYEAWPLLAAATAYLAGRASRW